MLDDFVQWAPAPLDRDTTSRAVEATLSKTQRKDGSWKLGDAGDGGRIDATALASLMLVARHRFQRLKR